MKWYKEELVVVHRNVDLDAIISAYLYCLTKVPEVYPFPADVRVLVDDIAIAFIENKPATGIDITTEAYLGEINLDRYEKVVILDMPMNPKLEKLLENVNYEHYDHHDGSAPSTARILWDHFELPAWTKYLVELADFSDTGKVLSLPRPVKLFHLTGYINALKQAPKPDEWQVYFRDTDIYLISRIFTTLEIYKTMLTKLVEAEEASLNQTKKGLKDR